MPIAKKLSIVIAVVTLAACGGSGGGYNTDPGSSGNNPPPPPPPSGSSNTVTLQATSFSPTTISVNAGTTVTWEWAPCTDDGYGGTCPTHAVTFDDGSNIASATQSTGTFTRTFATAGTYKYHCAIHGATMSGQVVVQ